MDLTLPPLLAQYGYVGLAVLLGLGIVALPVPDEVVLSLAGYLAARGQWQLAPTYLAAFLGSVCGISISYALGRGLGVSVLRRWGQKNALLASRLDQAEAWFSRWGKWLLPVGYFIPGVRHWVAVVAGASRLRAGVFCAFAYSGALLWTSSFITLTCWLGQRSAEVAVWQRWLWLLPAVVALTLGALWRFSRRT